MHDTETGLLRRHPWIARRLITVDDYQRMGEVGILTEDDRVELIEGELVAMSPIGSDHSGTVNALNRLLVRAVGDTALVAVQNPVRLDAWSEPQPDFAVLRPRPDDYRSATPRPDDVLLLIEVANSSLAYDRAIKRALYARHGIAEFWIVDLAGREVEVCRDPLDGRYATGFRAAGDATLVPVLLPEVRIAVADIIGV